MNFDPWINYKCVYFSFLWYFPKYLVISIMGREYSVLLNLNLVFFFFFLSFSTWSVLVNVSSVHEKNVYSVGYSILYVSVWVSCWYYLALCVTTDVLYACFINYWESNCRFVYLLTSVSFYFMYFEALIRYTHLGLLCLNELTYHYEMSLLHITFFFLEFCV